MFKKPPATTESEFSPADRKTILRYFNDLITLTDQRRRNHHQSAAMPGSFADATLAFGNLDLAAHMAAAAEMRPIRASVADQYPGEADIERETQRETLAKAWAKSADPVLRAVSAQTLKQVASDRETRALRAKHIAAEKKLNEPRDREREKAAEPIRARQAAAAAAAAAEAERIAVRARITADAAANRGALVG